MAKRTIKAIVKNMEEILFEGEVDRISSFNEVGPFDVYPMHANFISILTKQLSFFHEKQKVKELQIEQAVMKVKADQVHIFLGIEAFNLDENSQTAAPSSPSKK